MNFLLLLILAFFNGAEIFSDRKQETYEEILKNITHSTIKLFLSKLSVCDCFIPIGGMEKKLAKVKCLTDFELKNYRQKPDLTTDPSFSMPINNISSSSSYKMPQENEGIFNQASIELQRSGIYAQLNNYESQVRNQASDMVRMHLEPTRSHSANLLPRTQRLFRRGNDLSVSARRQLCFSFAYLNLKLARMVNSPETRWPNPNLALALALALAVALPLALTLALPLALPLALTLALT